MSRKIAILLLLLLFALPLQAGAAANLLQNGGFEAVQDGKPSLWAENSFLQDSKAAQFRLVSGQAHTGSRYIEIENVQANDAKWVQTVQVKPRTVYRLSGWVKADGIGDGHTGANLSILDTFAVSKDVKDTLGQWQKLELVGYTDRNQTEIQIAARLGGYGSLNTGTAAFDDISLEPLTNVPAGADSVPFFHQDSGTMGINHPVYSVSMMLCGLLYAVFFMLVLTFMIKRKPPEADTGTSSTRLSLYIVLGAAFAVRVFTAPLIQGHPIDYTDFFLWAKQAYSAGLAHFYGNGMFADYPPGYIYVLYILGLVIHAFSLDMTSAAGIILLKLPAIVSDIATAGLLYIYAKKQLGARTGLALAMLYAFNPGVYLNSTLWAQIDSVFTLVVLLMIVELYRERLSPASVLFAAAFLIKPQALIFAPLFLFAYWKKSSLPAVLKSLGYGAGVFVLAVLPFALFKPPMWIVSHYVAMFQSYPYASLNAFNLYAWLGANTVPQEQSFLFLSYNAWGMIFTVATVAFTAFLFAGNKAASGYFYLAFLIVFLVFNLKTGMHERYDYAAVALIAASYIFMRDKRLLFLFAAVSLVHFANVAYVLRDALDKNYFLDPHDGWMKWLSLADLLLLVYACKLGYDLFVRRRAYPLAISKALSGPLFKPFARMDPRQTDTADSLLQPQEKQAIWQRRDYLLIFLLTAVYAVIALYHLGSFKDPQTYWKPANFGESFTVDFGQVRNVREIKWFAGLGEGEYALEQSDDKLNWKPVTHLEQTYQTVFAWQETPLDITARYVRFSVEKTQGTLHEIGFFGDKLKKPYAVKVTSPEPASAGSKSSVQHLFDEQSVIPEHPSYMNSTYFDEIYHARTAYEHLHRIEPYENTHPPLGKIFISAGIALFGLDPFGWRIVGTLFGIAMVPIMYMFGMRLFKRSSFAFITAFLFTFDFMHFAQTRIATIDVYGTFFIILMYYSMYRYYTMNFFRDGLRKTWIPLAFSGLFFGLGSASKWIGVYAGAGLAVLFFHSIRKRMKEYKAAQKELASESERSEADKEQLEAIVRRFPSYTIKTILWCGLFFIPIPVIIYIASYIPFMLVPGPGHGLIDVLKEQKHMYEYHKNLVATHPFSSQWWEWPIMFKPIWYFAGKYMALGKSSDIVSMGNPAVWWPGIATLLATIWIGIKKRDRLALFIVIGFASQYLPWVGVPRLTFIYHYFASVPFVVLSIVYVLKAFHDQVTDKKLYRIVAESYLFIVLLLFVMFYPILSGLVVDKWYVETFLRWFPQWYFYS